MKYRVCPRCGNHLDHGEICDCRRTMNLHGNIYPITGETELPDGSTVPMVDIPMMSDYKWQRKALESRLQHPEHYANHEDVNAAIIKLRRWLADHAPQ